MTRDQILAKAVAIQKIHPELRLGQTLMNFCISIKEYHSVPANIDPFYVDERIPEFLDWLLEHRNENKF